MQELEMKFYSNRSPKKGYSWETAPEKIAESEIVETLTADVIMIGGGISGLAAGARCKYRGLDTIIIDKNKTIRLMNYDNVVTDEPIKPETQKITLFDNSGSLKLSLSPENLYYIESDDNYIKVWYTDNKGELKQYMLRCRLKTVEESFKDTGLVRCHRKYIVNIKKVKVLRKESEGYVLDLDNEDIHPLTVTKTYTDSVLSHFTGESPLLEPIDY